MGILSDSLILTMRDTGDLVIDPWTDESVQPASYDIHLGNRLILQNGDIWDFDREGPWRLSATDMMVMGTTLERFKLSTKLAASIGGISSLGRRGVVVTPGAPWVDPGFEGELTMEITMTSRDWFSLTAGIRIAQLVFHKVEGEVLYSYSGKYQGQSGPTHDRTVYAPNAGPKVTPVLERVTEAAAGVLADEIDELVEQAAGRTTAASLIQQAYESADVRKVWVPDHDRYTGGHWVEEAPADADIREVRQAAEYSEAAYIEGPDGSGVSDGVNKLTEVEAWKSRAEADRAAALAARSYYSERPTASDDSELLRMLAHNIKDHAAPTICNRLLELADILELSPNATNLQAAHEQLSLAYTLFQTSAGSARIAGVSNTTFIALEKAASAMAAAREHLLADKQFKQQFPAATFD